MTARVAAAVLAVVVAAAPAQDRPLDRFGDLMRQAVQQSARGRPRDLRAARTLLEQALAVAADIDDERARNQAHFFAEVRLADLWFRGNQLPRCAEAATAARERAIARGVYGGPYQATVLVLLWQCQPPERFFPAVEDEPADLALLAAPDTAGTMAIPVRLIAADHLFFERREPEAVAALIEASRRLGEADAALGAVWSDKCHGALVWHLLERREYARAEVFVDLLRDERRRRYYRAILAVQRGDFVAVERQLADAREPQELLLLADALEQLGRIEAAAAKYEEAGRAGAGDDALRAAACNGLGDCRRRQHRKDEAEALYRQSLALLAGDLSPRGLAEVAENEKDLGLLAEAGGDAAMAHAHFAAALATVERGRAGLPIDPFGASFLEPGMLAAVDGALRTHAAAADGFAVLAFLERVKARSLLDRVGQPRALADAPEVLAAVRGLALARDEQAVAARRLELERARAAVAARAGVEPARPLAATALRAAADAAAGELWLSYWLGEDRGWLVSVADGIAAVVDLGPAAALRARSAAAYAAVASAPGEGEGTPDAALAAAADAFVPAAVRAALRAARRVVFCPDAASARLPLEALPVDGEALGVRLAVERAPSLSVRAVLAARAGEGGGGVVVLDSVAASPAAAEAFDRLGVGPLRFSDREAQLVQRAWPSAARLSGGDASLDRLRALLARTGAPRLLHVSAHAVLRGAVPSASLLLLADGAVPLSSLADLPLQGATVVLSACSSAVGESRGGEGEASLLWGPFGGGARAVVASAWAVNQQATCDLMGQLHHHLAAGCDEAEALRRARAALAATANYRHPHYWAGFAAYGSHPAATASPFSWWWLAPLLLLPVLTLRRRRVTQP